MCSMKVHLRPKQARKLSMPFHAVQLRGAWVLAERDDGWRIPDVLWAQIEPLIPAGKEHPLGCYNPRVHKTAATRS